MNQNVKRKLATQSSDEDSIATSLSMVRTSPAHRIENENSGSHQKERPKLSERFAAPRTVSTVSSPSDNWIKSENSGPCPRVPNTSRTAACMPHNRQATGLTFREESIRTNPPLLLFGLVLIAASYG